MQKAGGYTRGWKRVKTEVTAGSQRLRVDIKDVRSNQVQVKLRNEEVPSPMK